MRARVIAAFVLTWAYLAAAGAAGAQTITGTVVDDEGPVRGFGVQFMDAVNAVPAGAATTDFAGMYTSQLLSAGEYRIRFAESGFAYIKMYAPTFFGAGGLDDFCSATPIAVGQSEVAIADVQLPISPPGAMTTVVASGTVTDAATGAPLSGIHVQLFDARNAVLLHAATTDETGSYEVGSSKDAQSSSSGEMRLRFSDPSRNYLPHFAGAATDAFCSAGKFESHATIDAAMRPMSADVATASVIEVIDALEAPASVQESLAAPLLRAVDMLTDDHASNDAATCGQLEAFMSRIAMEERRRTLSPEEAAQIRSAAEFLQTFLGCH